MTSIGYACSLGALCATLVLVGCAQGVSRAENAPHRTPPATQALTSSSMVVAMTPGVEADPAWRAVAEALVTKHAATRATHLVRFDPARPETLIEPLRTHSAEFLTVVIQPQHAGRSFVSSLHRAMRRIDGDPSADVRWGIVTARTARGAQRLVTETEPLVAKNAFGTADFPMHLFEHATWWSEEAVWTFTMHEEVRSLTTRDGEHQTRQLDERSIGQAVADAINTAPIDLVLTGGHATERGLELGFRKAAGRLGPHDGSIVVECRDGTRLPVSHAAPKAWIGVGNCLIGNVDGADSMAAVAVEEFGVRAHVGYVVVTWFGRGGWGTLKAFTEPAGARTLNEAWATNNAAMIDELGRRWPQLAELNLADVVFDGWLEDNPDRFMHAVHQAVGDRVSESELPDLIGLLWDRDAVSYIGDPTWDIRVPQ